MATHAEKPANKQLQTEPDSGAEPQSISRGPVAITDNRPAARAQRQQQALISTSARLQAGASLQAQINQSLRLQPATPAPAHVASRAAPVQKTANQTGLPDDLKAGVENLSGYSLDDVQVHYNSAKPAQLQAHAYAQGTDIHVAPGQEQHLPHEAWHVVQQKQGRVKPTKQLKGKQLNDNSALEKEAATMGQAALSVRPPAAGALSQIPLTTSPITQRKVIQLITSQIIINDAARIVQVVIRGRPPRVHRDSMGDHTSAFIIHTEGINIALQGKTLAAAVAYVKTLIDELPALPGASFMGLDFSSQKSKTEIGARFGHELVSLTHHYTAAANALNPELAPPNDNMALQHLQQAINAYLNARELVPFSTINVGAKSTGLAGKGRGEATAAATLSTFERNPASGIEDFDLTAAVYKLFDDQSATMVAAETNEMLVQAMASGITFGGEKDPLKKLMLIWEQHRQSISKRFPKVYAKIGGHLDTTRLAHNLHAVKAINIADLLRQAAVSVEMAEGYLSSYTRDYSNQSSKDPLNRGAFNKKKLTAISTIYRSQKNALALLPEIKELNTQLNNEFLGNILLLEAQLQQSSRVVGRVIAQYDKEKHYDLMESTLVEATESARDGGTDAIKTIEHLRTFQDGDPVNSLKPTVVAVVPPAPKDLSAYTRGKEKKERGPSRSVETDTLTRSMSAMSIQIVLNPANGSVAEMLSSGRPPSPFKGTMGAHTTSWVVHLDRVRSAIKGRSIPHATTAVLAILADVRAIANRRVKSDFSNLGDNAREIFDASYASMMGYATVNPVASNIIILQQMINATLSLYNLIPGVSVDKINTTGHGEGTARQTMLRYELYGQGSQEELARAINTLYDGGTSGEMRGLHGTFIAQAYPKAHQFATTGVSTAAKKEIPPSAAIGDDTEEDAESSQLSETELAELLARKDDSSWLVGVNNCLINAITDGAGVARATGDQVVAIRTNLGVPLGEMLFASQRVLNIILADLGLAARGTVVLYEGHPGTDRSSNVSANPIMVYHDGINHFTALHNHRPQPDSSKPTLPEDEDNEEMQEDKDE